MGREQSGCCCGNEHLTEREVDVAALVAAGDSNAEIAKRLNVSIHTVVRHMTAMLRKTGEVRRAGLVTRMYRDGILAVGDDGPAPTGRRCLQSWSGHPGPSRRIPALFRVSAIAPIVVSTNHGAEGTRGWQKRSSR
jgi:DNA-binding CsgD family transcriptional regulator